MIFFILLAIGLFLGFLAAREFFWDLVIDTYGNIISKILLSLVGVFLGLVIAATFTLLTSAIVSVLVASSAPNVTHVKTTHLSALGNDVEGSGHFFLGSGQYKEDQYYNYIVKHKDGGLTLESVKAKDITLYEDATPETATYVETSHAGDYWWLFPGEFPAAQTEGVFHIPAGSVDTSYKVSVN